MSMKNPVTPAGIEPAIFRFIAQHLNHCTTAVPRHYYVARQISFKTDESSVKIDRWALPQLKSQALRLTCSVGLTKVASVLNRTNKSEGVLIMFCAKPRICYVTGNWVQFTNDEAHASANYYHSCSLDEASF
jgi:hypothetical protein